MTEERTTPLRQRMIEDLRIRGMDEKAQQAHIRAVKDFATFLCRSPDTATSEELRAYQLHMTDAVVTPSTFNARIVALRFFFGMTCGREEMKRFMQFRTEQRRLPVVFSLEEVSDILMAAPGPAGGQPDLATPVESGLHLGQEHGGHQKGRHAAHPAPQLRDPSAGGEHRCSRDPGSAGSRQAVDHGAIYPCRNQDDPRHGEPLRDADEAAAPHRPAKSGVTPHRGDPAQAGVG